MAKPKPRTVAQLRSEIQDEVKTVGLLPYSHNIISLCLAAIAKTYGKEQANLAIEDFNLEAYGWQKVK